MAGCMLSCRKALENRDRADSRLTTTGIHSFFFKINIDIRTYTDTDTEAERSKGKEGCDTAADEGFDMDRVGEVVNVVVANVGRSILAS